MKSSVRRIARGARTMTGHLEGVNFLRELFSVLHIDDGDFADKLCGKTTVAIIGSLSVVLMTSLYWGDPITCWVPAEYTDAWRTFVDQYCYVHGTYYVPMDTALSWDRSTRRQTPINYYQWVPYVLAIQAVSFYLPRLIWKSSCKAFSINMKNLANDLRHWWFSMSESSDGYTNAHGLLAQSTAPQFWASLALYRENKPRVALPLCYLFCKALQCLNALLQWFLLNEFLGSPLYPYWGVNIIIDLLNGVDWQITGHFPRVTHCDFSRRRPASFQLDTVICVLTLNVYYEKVAIFLWFWMLLMVLISFCSAFYWLWVLCVPFNHSRFIRTHLSAIPINLENAVESRNRKEFMDPVKLEMFIVEDLGLDGVFVLRHLTSAVGQLPVAYFVGSLLITSETTTNTKHTASYISGMDFEANSNDKREMV